MKCCVVVDAEFSANRSAKTIFFVGGNRESRHSRAIRGRRGPRRGPRRGLGWDLKPLLGLGSHAMVLF